MLEKPRMKPYKSSKRPFRRNMKQRRSMEPGMGPPGPDTRLYRRHMRHWPVRGPPEPDMRPHRCLTIPPRSMGPPGSDMGPPGPDMGPPGPGMGPYRYHMGPGPDMGPPGPDMGPPGPDMGPWPDMGPPGPDMRRYRRMRLRQGMGPPGPDMRPYRYHMGPGPDMGPPGPDMRPYRYHMGPGLDMGPPGPDMRPYRHHMVTGPDMGPPEPDMEPHGPRVGPPGPSMWPPRQNKGIRGKSGSDIGHPGIPPSPPQVMRQPAMSDFSNQPPKMQPGQSNSVLWVEHMLPTGKVYYYDVATRVSSWTRPENACVVRQAEFENIYKAAHGLTETGKSTSLSHLIDNTYKRLDEVCNKPQPEEAASDWTQWREHNDPSGRTYYNNICTQASVWDKPQVLLDFDEKLKTAEVSQAQTNVQQNADADTDDSSDESEEQVVEAPPEWTQWREHKNFLGRTYYYNICTKESVWDNKPQVLLDLEEKLRIAGVSQTQTNVQENAAADTDDSSDESEEEVVEEIKKQPEAVEEKEPEQTPKPEPKPVNKSRPVARIAIPGTVWYLVRTSDGRCFFYNPSKRHSAWERPEELKNRPDVDKLLSLDVNKLLPPKPEVETEDKEDKNVQEEPPSKKMRSETEVTEEKKDTKNEFAQQTVLGKEAQGAQQSSVVSMEVKMKLFKELLAEKNISAHAKWETELNKIASDKRYLLLTSRERRQVFEEYVKDRAEKEDSENNHKINEKKELYGQLLEESNLNEKSEAEVKEVKEGSNKKVAQQIGLGKEAAIEDEVEAAKQRPVVSIEAKMKQFKELLAEKDVSAYSTWEKESYKIIFDKRYFLLTLQERRQAFEEYVKDRAEEERSEKNSEVKKTTELHKQSLEDNNLNVKAETKMKEVKEERNNEVAQQIALGKEAAIEAEVEAAKQRSVSLEVRMKQFKEMMAEKDVSAHSTWEKELYKIVFDKRYLLLTSQERKQAFEEYVRNKAEQDKNKSITEKKELYRQFLEDSILNGKAETKMKEVKKESNNKVAEQIHFGKEAAVEAVVEAAKHRSVVSLEVRMKQFKEMLAEKDVSAHSTWEKELHKIVFDKRYLLLTSQDRKRAFEEYVRNKAKHDKNKTISEKKELYRQLLKDSKLNGKSTFKNFVVKYSRDKRFNMIDKMEDRKSMFLDYIRELAKQEKLKNASIKEKVKNDFMQMVTEIPGINSSTTWSDVRRKVSSDPRYEAAVTDSRREDWFREYLKTLNNASYDDIGTKGEQEKKPHSSSLKEKSESGKNHREEVIADFKQFLAEKVTRSEDSYGGFKSLFYTNPIWKVALPLIDTEKLYNSHIDEVHKKNRAILWSILDGIDLSLTTVWDTVLEKVQADPRFLNYTDSEKKQEKEYAVYMRKKFLKAKEDFQELLKETKLITPETKTKLQQGGITLKGIECLLQTDKRYTALACISKQREQMIHAYINELSEKNQPSHS